MNLFKDFQVRIDAMLQAMADEGLLPAGLDLSRVTVEPPRDPSHGDMSTNAAMVLARPAGLKPRDLAALLVERLSREQGVTDLAVAGPGFVNWRLSDAIWLGQLATILEAGERYGDSALGQGRKVNVEYVSANPTGPLTVGHARGAVVGDALAGLLAKAGYDVTREYYINDAGNQVDTLARTAHLRYREALGEAIGEIPVGMYPGEYMIDVGRALAERDGDKWRGRDEAEWLAPVRAFAIEFLMGRVRSDLAAIGIEQAVFSSERALVEAGAVDAVFETLERRGLLYTGVLEPPKGKTPEDWEPRPQTLFRATDFGDDVDRPLRKSDGSWTYFANDMAYHLDKFRRGFTTQIDVWGADHGGYIRRMQAAVQALSEGQARLHIVLCQLVKLTRGGVEVKMSKRSGNFVTLSEVTEEVGKDVLRFIMLTRKHDAPLDFDLEKVLEQSKDNPVFYVQYAHARAHSVLRHAAEAFPGVDQAPAALAGGPVHRLTDSHELGLIKLLAGWPRLVESAAEAYEPHRIAFYLNDVAAAFHGLWTKGKDETSLRFLVADDAELTAARLALLRAVALVIASGLRIFGVEPLEEMR
ncbi:arginyl-tRNA synthetase [Tistlia consotensis]|uniref:Arginine--tRNA ligase n=1 Tax=Tistlia consotensis USBA 355 TaxID=560819 RepID=A0A1Y6BPT0_9PROT|nr:arginine--tRNA ligase [Tistlia consotensis]SMF14217.1 arginyl-tRNA synthetase [Tistlia consotensis USBA 355]SNR49684.1 arginyl-tRNA synthetase [Tistlia consotensis]